MSHFPTEGTHFRITVHNNDLNKSFSNQSVIPCLSLHTRTHTRTHVHTYVHLHSLTRSHARTNRLTCACIYSHACTYIRTHMHVCLPDYLNAYLRIQLPTPVSRYTHTRLAVCMLARALMRVYKMQIRLHITAVLTGQYQKRFYRSLSFVKGFEKN